MQVADDTIKNYWLRFRQGDKEALVQLYKAVHKDLLLYGMRLCVNKELVKDTINDVFLDLWKNRGLTSSVAFPRAYLLGCLRNKLLRLRTRENKYHPVHISDHEEDIAVEHSYEERLMNEQRYQEITRRVRHALKKLTPRQKEVVHLKFYAGLTVSQIEACTGMGTKTIYNTIYNAIKVLSAELSDSSLV